MIQFNLVMIALQLQASMIITRISNTLGQLAGQKDKLFYNYKAAITPKMFIKNDNLTYEDANHKLTTYFFLPELKNKSSNTYEINKYSNALSFVWQPKQSRQVDSHSNDSKKGNELPTKLSFSFRYPEIQSLLQVLPKSGRTSSIQRKKANETNEVHQILTMIDNPEKKFIHYNYRSLSKSLPDKIETRSKVEFQFAYSKHRIFQILLRKSLFELSGMGIIYDLKRELELSSEQNENLRKRNQIEKEAAEFYKR